MGLTLGRIDVHVKLFAHVPHGPFSFERRGEARPNESAEHNARHKEQVKSPAAGHGERDRLVRLRVVVSTLVGQDQKGSKDACLEEETD